MAQKKPLVHDGSGGVEELQAADYIKEVDIPTFTNGNAGTLLPGAICYQTATTQEVDKAQSNAAGTMDAVCFNVASLATATAGPMQVNGVLALTTGEWDAVIEGATTVGLVTGTVYFVSASAPGEISITAPSGAGNIVQRVGTAKSPTEMNINIGRPLKLA